MATKKTAAKKSPAKKAPAKKSAAKKPAAKKAPAKKAPAVKKAAAKKKSPAAKRKPNAAFMKAPPPNASVALVNGQKAPAPTQVTKKIWDYIKKNKLQDA